MNYAQSSRISRMHQQPLYLIDQEKDNVEESIFAFKIAGSTANLYHVKVDLSKKTLEEMITCNCPDSFSHARAKNVKCKHCCFVWIKVLRLTDDGLLWNELTITQQEKVNTKCQNIIIRRELVNEDYIKKYQMKKEILPTKEDTKDTEDTEDTKDKLSSKFQITRDLDEVDCPICFDQLESDNSSECPTCHNAVHTKCIRKWISMRNKNCVYCRSSWDGFEDKKKSEVKTNSVSYLNLDED